MTKKDTLLGLILIAILALCTITVAQEKKFPPPAQPSVTYDDKAGYTSMTIPRAENATVLVDGTRVQDRLDTICGDSEYAVCMIQKEDFGGYSSHTMAFTGCGCGNTKEDATAYAITAWVNSNFFVDFNFLKPKNYASRDKAVDMVFDYKTVEVSGKPRKRPATKILFADGSIYEGWGVSGVAK
jgi:hypothetical protein